MSDPNASFPPPDPGQVVPPPAYPPPAYPPPPYEPQVFQQRPAEPYASWGRRVAATLLDVLVLVPGYVLLIIGSVVIAGSVATRPDGTATVTDGTNLVLGVVLTSLVSLATFIFSLWNQIFRQGRRGASLGKQMVGILVISEDDARPIGAGLTFVRQIVHLLDGVACYVGYLWPLWDEKKQTFADKIMKTAVLHLPDVRF